MKKKIGLVLLLALIGGCSAPTAAPENADAMVGLSVKECVSRYGLSKCKVYVNPRSAEPRTDKDGNMYFTLTTTYYLPDGNLYLTEGKGIVVGASFHTDERTIEERIRVQQKRWSEFVEGRNRNKP